MALRMVDGRHPRFRQVARIRPSRLSTGTVGSRDSPVTRLDDATEPPKGSAGMQSWGSGVTNGERSSG